MRIRHTIFAILPVLLFAGCISDPNDSPPDPGHSDSGSPSPSRDTEINIDVITVRARTVPSDVRQRMEIVRVTGLADPDRQQRINQRLRELPEQTLDAFEETAIAPSDPTADLEQTTNLRATATVGLRGPDLLSVLHRYEADGAELGRMPGLAYDPATIDLRTGKQLRNRDLLSERVGTAEGARGLERLLQRSGPDGELCGPRPAGARGLQPSDFLSENPSTRAVAVFPEQGRVTFALGLAKLGYPMSCARQDITVDDSKLREFLAPALRRAVDS